MASPVPPNFTDLDTATSRLNRDVNIMGRVTDFLPPSRSRGIDWMCTLSMADSTYSGERDEGIKIRLFRPTQADLPHIQSSGDVLLFRNIKIKQYQGVTMGLSTFSTRWIMFPTTGIPTKAPSNAIRLKYLASAQAGEPTQSEMRYAIELCNSEDRTNDKPDITVSSGLPSDVVSTPVASDGSLLASSTSAHLLSLKSGGRGSIGGRDKFSLIKDLKIDTFYNVVGQVVKIYPTMGRLEMYITDYTSNNMLYRYEWDKEEKENYQYGDPHGYLPVQKSKSDKWPGPYGHMTIMVTLWPPHSHFAQSNVKDWDFVFLQNVRAKQDKDGKMEAALHEDRFHASKLCVGVLSDHSDERVKDVLRRKREYGEKFKMQSAQLIAQARNQNGKEKPLSKAQQRAKRKLDRDNAAREKEEPAGKKQKQDQNNPDPSGDGSSQDRAELLRKRSRPLNDEQQDAPLPKNPVTRNEVNKNVHCSHHTVPTRSLSSILSLDFHENTSPAGNTYILPFQNIKSRTITRVVDFFPSNLADFAVPRRQRSEYDTLSDYEPTDSSDASIHPPASMQRGLGDGSENESEQKRQWEWRFGLVLEDVSSDQKIAKGNERALLTAYVAGQDAEFLLKLDASDLRADQTALITLREKLFLLWGDLEEKKTQLKATPESRQPPPIPAGGSAPLETVVSSSKPFQCCLQEYGVRKGRGEWERKWRLFGTTII